MCEMLDLHSSLRGEANLQNAQPSHSVIDNQSLYKPASGKPANQVRGVVMKYDVKVRLVE